MSEIEPFLPITLPSRCVQYGVNSESIKIRAYTGLDEIFLAEVNPTNLYHKYAMILKGAMVGIDPNLLTVGDIQYIMVWEYAKSYGGIISEKTVCGECLEDIDISVDLRELDVVYIPEGFTVPHLVHLPDSGVDVNLRLLTVGDEISDGSSGSMGLVYKCARTIVDDKNMTDRINFLGKLKAIDLATIRGFHEKYYHGPNMSTKFVCPKCGKDGVVNVPFRLDFIFPRGEALARLIGKGI
jgi:hypothetical protein